MSPRMGLTKDKIMETAANMADSDGIGSVTIANLAKKLKIQPPSLYNHIQGLNELKTVMAIYGLNQLHDEMKEALGGKEGDKAVHALGDSYLAFSRSHPGLYEAALLAPEPGNTDVQAAGNRIVELALGTLHYLEISEQDALHAVRGLRSVFHGFASLENKGGFEMDLSINESFQRMIDVFLKGIKTGGKQ
ncbi:TetR/AcrR family transcriptional regulator [Rossellomorea vietnamensis]|nr:TetR/AcrR family transcriptional regulator [Rossellomorea vietnamensis]